MKCKVRLTQTVEMIVEGLSEDDILEWLYSTTPQEAIDVAMSPVDVSYDEEIVCYVSDYDKVDYVITED